MYAIIECGGKQYRVSEGDMLRVEKLNAEAGTVVEVDRVLLIGGDQTVIGTPFIDGAKVSCKVMNHDKAKKIMVFHYKAKKNIRKTYGHRQPFTSLLVEKIVTADAAPAKKASKAAKTSQEETAASAEKPKRTRKKAVKTEATEKIDA